MSTTHPADPGSLPDVPNINDQSKSFYATGEEYLYRPGLPNTSCAGCGNGIVSSALMRSFETLQIPRHKIVVVPGIGCAGMLNRYMNTNYMHCTHGRALAFSTGMKAANPELTVVPVVGDGDGATIGGNHLIHAARRNIGITVLLINNYNYGMTGGQVSGTTPHDAFTSTTIMGNPERGFDLCSLLLGAGACFVARETTAAGLKLQKIITEALRNPGFSFVEIMSPCTTLFGPRNGMKSSVAMLRWLKEKSMPKAKFDALSKEEQAAARAEGRFPVGIFANENVPSFTEQYEEKRQKFLAKARG